MEVTERKVSRTGERIMLTIEHDDRPDTYEVWALGDEICELIIGLSSWVYAVEVLVGF